MKSKINNSLFEKVHYDGKTLSVKTITKDEVDSLDKESVDHFLAVDLGIWAFRNRYGQWIERNLSEHPIGNTCLEILEAVQCEPGVYFSPKAIAELTNIHSLATPNNLSARWRALRLRHNEIYAFPNFFLSKRAGGMGIAWNPRKTFTQIFRIGNHKTDNN